MNSLSIYPSLYEHSSVWLLFYNENGSILSKNVRNYQHNYRGMENHKYIVTDQ